MEIIMCANAHHHPLIPMNSFLRLIRHFGHELVLGKSNLGWLTVKLPFQVIHDWSMYLNPIPRYGKQNFFELKRQIIRMLLSSDAFAWFLPLVEYRYSYQIPCDPPDPSVDYYSTDFAYSETLEFFLWYKLTLVSQILYFNFGSILPKNYPLLLMVAILIR